MQRVVMQRLSYPTETVLSTKITRNRIVLSFKDSLREALGRRPGLDECPRILLSCFRARNSVQHVAEEGDCDDGVDQV